MKRFLHIFSFWFCCCLAIGISGCSVSHVPLTGRSQHLLVSDSEVLSLSRTQYRQYMQKARPSSNRQQTQMVVRVGQHLAKAVEDYLRTHGAADEIRNFDWEFNLVADPNANAFCMPGGKIVVYEGLLPYTRDEATLAIVLGHEIAHAVAKHSAEQMSQHLKAQYGAIALGALLNNSKSSALSKDLSALAFGFGSNSLLRKFSRNHEAEADYMGLIFAAMAGYNPEVAISFWQRMAASSTSRMPEFFSDHPSDAHRIRDLKKAMPEALKYYREATGKPAAAAAPATSYPFSTQKVKSVKASSFKK